MFVMGPKSSSVYIQVNCEQKMKEQKEKKRNQDCNISCDHYRPDTVQSTKQLRQTILPKDVGLKLTALMVYFSSG